MTAMCGIVGYTGARPALSIVVTGLRRLEYRGYDSAGVAVINDEALVTCKRAGKLGNLEQELAAQAATAPTGIDRGTTGIGHTRWATHGGPTDRNAHPHRSTNGRLAVIHNGIIENFAKLRAELQATGVEFMSDTDTECAAHLLEFELSALRAEDGPGGGAQLAEAMRRVCRRLEGAFTLLAVDADTPDVIIGARRNSPPRGRSWRGRELPRQRRLRLHRAHPRGDRARPGPGRAHHLRRDRDHRLRRRHRDRQGLPRRLGRSAAEKGGYDYFMLKEIAEQPRAIADTLRGRLGANGQLVMDEMRLSEQDLRDVDKVYIVACGTSYHAGLVAKYAIEHWTRLPVEVELASEFRYRDPVLDRSTLVVAISQSGETMDTLMALRHARAQKARVLAICNTNGSTIPRESDAVLYTHAGPEVAVASTKAFLTQVVACYLVGLHLAQARGVKFADEVGASSASCATPRPPSSRCWRRWSRSASWPVSSPSRGRCCSSGATSATRSRWRVRSSSRSSRTCTPKASPPASSSTARSRSSTTGPRSCAWSRPRSAAACCTTRCSPTSRRYGPGVPARS
jgi:glucosamine--fructose-6-phosphate aminotransferase (isomerizing)